MRARILLAMLICAIVLAGGIGYYSMFPEKELGLSVTMISNTVPAAFPTRVNVTSVIENTNSGSIDSLTILQTMPKGFNLTEVYVKADGSRLPYDPIINSDGMNYLLNSTLAPGEKVAIIVLLESTPVSASGNYMTIARGTCYGKPVESRGVVQVHVQPSVASCSDWDTIAFGEFLLRNDVWGGPDEPHLQCVTLGPGSFGWNSSRLSPRNNEQCNCVQPYYPEVVYGKNPSRTLSTTSSLPVALDSIKSLEVSLAAHMDPYTKYDLAFDIWIANNRESIMADITDEIMIWLLWTPDLAGGHVLDTLHDGYNIYQHRPEMIRREGSLRWTMHLFTIEKQGIPSRINVLAFFNHLTKEKKDLRYLASIEFGTEVWSGVGATAVTKFGVDLETMHNLESPITAHKAGYFEKGRRIMADKWSADIIDIGERCRRCLRSVPRLFLLSVSSLQLC